MPEPRPNAQVSMRAVDGVIQTVLQAGLTNRLDFVSPRDFHHKFRGLGRRFRKKHRCAARLCVALKHPNPYIQPVQHTIAPLDRGTARGLKVDLQHHIGARGHKLFREFFQVFLQPGIGEFFADTGLKVHGLNAHGV